MLFDEKETETEFFCLRCERFCPIIGCAMGSDMKGEPGGDEYADDEDDEYAVSAVKSIHFRNWRTLNIPLLCA
ncbi:hypothetical protein BpHYR1_030292 [Brachionus plicatilis]|uniref:Uncharacterized protein n=1 Tax=Brachionus plicatilis TaxID=10195 RepID=A0A3M7RT68_BRAPC|nr:hypothetical protein BpHYR1_030292 [Brachionus plicatilis]